MSIHDKQIRSRVVLVALALLLLAAGGLGFSLGVDSRILLSAVAATIAALVLYAVYFSVTVASQTATNRPADKVGPKVDFDQVLELADSLDGQIAAEQAVLFHDVLAYPSEAIQRLTESVRPGARSVIVQSDFNVLIPRGLATQSRVTLPLHVQPRGLLETGMRFFDGSGHEIPPHSQVHSLAYTAAVIRTLLSSIDAATVGLYMKTLEEDVLLQIVGSRGKSRAALEEWLGSFATRLWRLPESNTPGKRIYALHFVEGIVAASLQSNATCVDIDINVEAAGFGPLVRVSVERRSLPQLKIGPGAEKRPWWGWLMESLRSVLGVRPTVLFYELDNGARAASYHVEMAGPEGTFLARQELRDIKTGLLSDLSEVDYAFTRRRGQRHSHLYVRGGEAVHDQVLVNNYFERMPGSMGPAWLSAGAAAFLIWMCALTSRGIGPEVIHGVPEPHTDLVAILLAFPIVIALWAGLEPGSGQITVLVSLVSKIGTIVISLLAAARYLLGPFGDDGALEWNLIAAAATVNFAAALGSWLVRAWVHRGFLRR